MLDVMCAVHELQNAVQYIHVRDVASYLKVVWPKSTQCMEYLGGCGGMLPQEIFVKLD